MNYYDHSIFSMAGSLGLQSGSEAEPESEIGPSEPFLQEPKAEPELSEPFLRNRNKNRATPLNCTETYTEKPFPKGLSEPKTETANRSRRET